MFLRNLLSTSKLSKSSQFTGTGLKTAKKRHYVLTNNYARLPTLYSRTESMQRIQIAVKTLKGPLWIETWKMFSVS